MTDTAWEDREKKYDERGSRKEYDLFVELKK